MPLSKNQLLDQKQRYQQDNGGQVLSKLGNVLLAIVVADLILISPLIFITGNTTVQIWYVTVIICALIFFHSRYRSRNSMN